MNSHVSAARTWAELIEQLRGERDALVADFLERFTRDARYEPGLVDLDDVTANAFLTMDMFMYHLAGERPPAQIADLPRQIGARRARQGVPVEQFLEAIRIDFRVLWKGLERVAQPDGTTLLVTNMERVLGVVDAYVREVHQAFIDEEARLTRDSRIAHERALARLFTGELTPGALAEIAAALGLGLGAGYEVLVADGDDGTWLADEFRTSPSVVVYERGGGTIAFRERTGMAEWPSEHPGLRGGYVGSVAGLARVPAAAVTARLLGAQGGGVVTVADAWMSVAADHLAVAIPEFATDIEEEIRALTDHERERLLQAVRMYAETGSVKESAQRLYCHRNTMVNRLRAFHELTGLDVTVPNQAAWALVVLARIDA